MGGINRTPDFGSTEVGRSGSENRNWDDIAYWQDVAVLVLDEVSKIERSAVASRPQYRPQKLVMKAESLDRRIQRTSGLYRADLDLAQVFADNLYTGESSPGPLEVEPLEMSRTNEWRRAVLHRTATQRAFRFYDARLTTVRDEVLDEIGETMSVDDEQPDEASDLRDRVEKLLLKIDCLYPTLEDAEFEGVRAALEDHLRVETERRAFKAWVATVEPPMFHWARSISLYEIPAVSDREAWIADNIAEELARTGPERIYVDQDLKGFVDEQVEALPRRVSGMRTPGVEADEICSAAVVKLLDEGLRRDRLRLGVPSEPDRWLNRLLKRSGLSLLARRPRRAANGRSQSVTPEANRSRGLSIPGSNPWVITEIEKQRAWRTLAALWEHTARERGSIHTCSAAILEAVALQYAKLSSGPAEDREEILSAMFADHEPAVDGVLSAFQRTVWWSVMESRQFPYPTSRDGNDPAYSSLQQVISGHKQVAPLVRVLGIRDLLLGIAKPEAVGSRLMPRVGELSDSAEKEQARFQADRFEKHCYTFASIAGFEFGANQS